MKTSGHASRINVPRLKNSITAALESLICLLLLVSATTVVKPDAPGEYAVKAAFIPHFVKFVIWPTDGSNSVATLRLCILGSDPFGDDLDSIRGQLIDGVIWEIQLLRTADDTENCRMVFIAASESDRLQTILAKLDSRAVLTLGDSEGFAERGVMINFYLEDRKVRFEINLAAARKAGFDISSQLLKLARIIQGKGDSDG